MKKVGEWHGIPIYETEETNKQKNPENALDVRLVKEVKPEEK